MNIKTLMDWFFVPGSVSAETVVVVAEQSNNEALVQMLKNIHSFPQFKCQFHTVDEKKKESVKVKQVLLLVFGCFVVFVLTDFNALVNSFQDNFAPQIRMIGLFCQMLAIIGFGGLVCLRFPLCLKTIVRRSWMSMLLLNIYYLIFIFNPLAKNIYFEFVTNQAKYNDVFIWVPLFFYFLFFLFSVVVSIFFLVMILNQNKRKKRDS